MRFIVCIDYYCVFTKSGAKLPPSRGMGKHFNSFNPTYLTFTPTKGKHSFFYHKMPHVPDNQADFRTTHASIHPFLTKRLNNVQKASIYSIYRWPTDTWMLRNVHMNDGQRTHVRCPPVNTLDKEKIKTPYSPLPNGRVRSWWKHPSMKAYARRR